MNKKIGVMIAMTDIENLIDFLEKHLKNDTSNNSREFLISNKYPIDLLQK